MKYLFICAHPDDLEFSCGNLIHYLAQHGKNIDILCLTKGEFGILEPNWKGPRLAKIRVQELRRAAKINGIDSNHVYTGDIIDGFIRFTKDNLKMMIEWINQLKPDIVFAPEAYYTYYWHVDHISIGKLLYYIFTKLRNKLNNPIQTLYFYTTAKGTFSWPFNNTEQCYKAIFAHESQWWLLKWTKLFYPLEKHNFKKRKLGNWKMLENYRRVKNSGKEPKTSIFFRAILGLIRHRHIINPPESHFILPDMNSPFGLEVKDLRKKYYFKD